MCLFVRTIVYVILFADKNIVNHVTNIDTMPLYILVVNTWRLSLNACKEKSSLNKIRYQINKFVFQNTNTYCRITEDFTSTTRQGECHAGVSCHRQCSDIQDFCYGSELI